MMGEPRFKLISFDECVELARIDAGAIREDLSPTENAIEALRMAYDGLVTYGPDYMHGLPLKTYLKRITKTIELLEGPSEDLWAAIRDKHVVARTVDMVFGFGSGTCKAMAALGFFRSSGVHTTGRRTITLYRIGDVISVLEHNGQDIPARPNGAYFRSYAVTNAQ